MQYSAKLISECWKIGVLPLLSFMIDSPKEWQASQNQYQDYTPHSGWAVPVKLLFILTYSSCVNVVHKRIHCNASSVINIIHINFLYAIFFCAMQWSFLNEAMSSGATFLCLPANIYKLHHRRNLGVLMKADRKPNQV
jgi:hypothetical protein